MSTQARLLPALRPTVAAAVIVHDGCVLLIRRQVPEGVGLTQLRWQFPAGVIEPGEDPERAAVRETAEETGVRSTAVLCLGLRVHPSTNRPIAYIACHYLTGTAHAAARAEVAEVAWPRIPNLARYIPHGCVFGPVQAYLSQQAPRRAT